MHREIAVLRYEDNLTAERPTFVTHLECAYTGERYPADQVHNLSRAGKPLLVRYDLPAIAKALSKPALAARAPDLWRYRELLPVRHTRDIVSLGEAMTPVVALPRLAAKLGGGELLVKDEGRLPTGSFKARGLVMAVSMAKAFGITHMAMPTNGNAGAALAAYATRCGIKTTIFCPEDTPEVNVSEIELQGATVYRVNGLIDDCGKIVGAGKAATGWFDVSTLKEPYRIEGKKTMGLELAEQLGWELPDAIFYPTGGGTGLIGMWKAFAELEAIGFIGNKRPRMIAVQAEGCAPDGARLRGRRGARAAVRERPHHRERHPGAAGDRGFSDPARGAREQRLRHRGERRGDYGGARRSRAHRRVSDVPGRCRHLRGLQAKPRRRPHRPPRARRAVQLRDGSEISAAAGASHARQGQADRFRKAVKASVRERRGGASPLQVA